MTRISQSFIVLLILMFEICCGNFLGGTISWMHVSKDRVRLTYRFAWEKGSGPCGPNCSPADTGRQGSVASPGLSMLKWVSQMGNKTTPVKDVNYVMTSISKTNVTSSEQGEGVIFMKTSFIQPITVSLSNIPWTGSPNCSYNASLGYMETYIDQRIRNDTGQPNGSPYTSLPSYIGIPVECESHVNLPVEDPEIDRVRCRLATASECGGACTNVPNNSIWLDKVSCTLTIKAFSAAGYKKKSSYRLTLVAEDFPDTTITMGTKEFTRRDSLSRIPIQITVWVLDGPCHKKYDEIEFVRPTLPNFSRSSFTMSDIIRHLPVATGFYLHSEHLYNISQTEVILSGPMYFNYSYFPDDLMKTLNRTNVIRIGVNWRPRIPDQIGYQQLCVWGIDRFGITTDARCITSIIADDSDHCAKGTVSCLNSGKCVNIFKVAEEKCNCTQRYKSRNCSQVIHCYDNPCENNGTCTVKPTGFDCQCDQSYTGTFCETKIKQCDSSPCYNGGTCVDGDKTFTCLCTSMYAGDSCEKKQQKSWEESDDVFLSWVLPIAIGSVAAIALVTSSCIVITGAYKRPVKKKSQVKPDNSENWRVSLSEITPVEEW